MIPCVRQSTKAVRKTIAIPHLFYRLDAHGLKLGKVVRVGITVARSIRLRLLSMRPIPRPLSIMSDSKNLNCCRFHSIDNAEGKSS